jgi:hypothetical protein
MKATEKTQLARWLGCACSITNGDQVGFRTPPQALLPIPHLSTEDGRQQESQEKESRFVPRLLLFCWLPLLPRFGLRQPEWE